MSNDKKDNLFRKLVKPNESSASETVPETVAEPSTSDGAEQPAAPSPAPPEAGSPPPSSRPRSSKKKDEPRGKRRHEDYVQANAYVPKTVHKAVHKQLVDMDGWDYSTLVTDLLKKWLKSRGVSA